MEHRFSMRFPLHIKAQVEFPGREAIPVWTRDISAKGVFIRLETDIPPNAMVKLRLQDELNTLSLEIPAVIAHHGHSGMGLMFGNLDKNTRSQLRSLFAEEMASQPNRKLSQ